MAISHNPTRTRRIEKSWLRDINRRWRAFTKATMTRLREMNEQSIVVNADEPFAMDDGAIRAFMSVCGLTFLVWRRNAFA